MKNNFKILALSGSLFESYFSMSDRELCEHDALWIDVDENPGYPCRVSLEDAEVGERVLAIPFCHHDVSSPYRSSGPIFVRENARQATLEVNEVPLMLRHRRLSMRAYNGQAIMVAAEVIDGTELEDSIARIFQDPSIEYIDIHNASPGCFNCRVVRA